MRIQTNSDSPISSIDCKKSFHSYELATGKRKSRRPITTKKAMHVTLRSSHAKGKLSFLTKSNAQIVKRLLEGTAKRFHVRVYRFAINGNHLHLLIKGKDRLGIQNFFRVFSGLVAEKLTRACRGEAFLGKFWDHLIFSRTSNCLPASGWVRPLPTCD